MSEEQKDLIVNAIVGDTFYDRIAAAAESVADLLSNHCGPFAKNAVIWTSIGQGTEVDDYTKDGITIAKQISTADPCVEYILRTVRHVGSRVDNVCHDGTTTSMLFIASLIGTMFGLHSKSETMLDNPRQFTDALTKVTKRLGECLKHNTITVEDVYSLANARTEAQKQKLRYAIAYHQAYTASKGDTELADAVGQVMCTIPKELYSMYRMKQSATERPKRIEIEHQAFDFEFASNMMAKELLNAKANTELHLTDAHVLFSTTPLIRDDYSTDALCSLLDLNSEERNFTGLDVGKDYLKGPLVVFAPQYQDVKLFELVNTWNRTHPDRKVYLLTIAVPQVTIWSYASGIAASMGVGTIPNSNILDALTKPRVKVEQAGNHVRLFNTYDKTKGTYHPYYVNKKKNPTYTKILEDIWSILDTSVIRHTNNSVRACEREFYSLYWMMVSQHMVDVRIGGTTHDLLANLSVADDALGSASSALRDGFVLGGYAQWAQYLKELKAEEHDTRTGQALHLFDTALSRVIKCTFKELAHKVIGKTIDRFSGFMVDTKDTSSHLGSVVEFKFDKELAKKLMSDPQSVRILMQPATGFTEQLKRIDELFPKIASSAMFVDTSMNNGRV